MEKMYITHVQREDLPLEGLRKLFYLTQREDPDEFFLAGDTNAIEKEEVNQWVTSGDFTPLPEKVELLQGKSLYINKDGQLYLANIFNSKEGQVPLHIKI